MIQKPPKRSVRKLIAAVPYEVYRTKDDKGERYDEGGMVNLIEKRRKASDSRLD